uniref:Uncharacterized protein n=1 Tax=Candidatus Kentrum sp. FW TaxID=2126338 RepID=A0A450U157_9GAMM|nr:MAG: hypothetical protein BECKFW1821C_GA0114237_109515 [Candidatus Kentron sp. FW]
MLVYCSVEGPYSRSGCAAARCFEDCVQDAVTDALIDHAVAKLELARDMGVLKVDGEGLRYEAGGALAE